MGCTLNDLPSETKEIVLKAMEIYSSMENEKHFAYASYAY